MVTSPGSLGKIDRLAIDGSLLCMGVGAVIATAIAMLASVMVGPRTFRTIRQWLLLVAVVAGWMTLALGRADLHWQGQQHRLARIVPTLATLAEQLHDDWPTNDGDRAGLGMFLAYPKPGPTMLLAVGTENLPGTQLKVASVERSNDGALRFELAGPEPNAWLEWRPAGGQPQGYVGGLQCEYHPQRWAQIAPEWYAVQYGFAL